MAVAKPPARDYFDARFQDLARHFNSGLGNVHQEVRSLGHQINTQFTEVNTKLDALMEMVAVRQEIRNLVRELRSKGVQLDETKIYVA